MPIEVEIDGGVGKDHYKIIVTARSLEDLHKAAQSSEAQQTDGIFGEITFGDPTERIDGVDITVLLGTDFLDKVATS